MCIVDACVQTSPSRATTLVTQHGHLIDDLNVVRADYSLSGALTPVGHPEAGVDLTSLAAELFNGLLAVALGGADAVGDDHAVSIGQRRE